MVISLLTRKYNFEVANSWSIKYKCLNHQASKISIRKLQVVYSFFMKKLIWFYTQVWEIIWCYNGNCPVIYIGNYPVIYRKLSGYILEIIWLNMGNYPVIYWKLSGYILEIIRLYIGNCPVIYIGNYPVIYWKLFGYILEIVRLYIGN